MSYQLYLGVNSQSVVVLCQLLSQLLCSALPPADRLRSDIYIRISCPIYCIAKYI